MHRFFQEEHYQTLLEKISTYFHPTIASERIYERIQKLLPLNRNDLIEAGSHDGETAKLILQTEPLAEKISADDFNLIFQKHRDHVLQLDESTLCLTAAKFRTCGKLILSNNQLTDGLSALSLSVIAKQQPELAIPILSLSITKKTENKYFLHEIKKAANVAAAFVLKK